MSDLKILPAQIKAARALLGWSVADLAAHAGVPDATIGRLEADEEEGAREAVALGQLVAAIEKAGAMFLKEGDEGVGVRLRRPHAEPLAVEELNASNDE